MTLTKPIVTVLMPVYNAEKYLRPAIESILNQTLPDFEFLIINDGSSDGSLDIIRSYTDPRIRFVQNEKNQGITYTLNRGIQLASCELIARMDADDISYPERLQKQYDYFQKHPDCVLLSNAVRYITAEGTKIRDVYFTYNFLYYDLIFSCKINHPVVMYKRSVLLKEGGYKTKYSEDFNLWCRLLRKNYEFFHDNEILLDYRFSETSLWKVTKKEEYEIAEYEQINNNIQYHSGGRLVFTYDEVDFLRKDLKHLIESKGIEFIKNCFRKLDQLDQFVLGNVQNKEKKHFLKQATLEKKRSITKNLKKYISRRRLIAMLIELNYWKLLSEELKQPVLKRLKFSN